MKTSFLNLTTFLLAISMLLFSCKKDSPTKKSQENLDQYNVTATFDNGETIAFKQFSPSDSDAGLLVSSCFFDGDNMTIGFGAAHLNDPKKSNGFSVGINVANVTEQRNYVFREENAAATNYTTFLDRIAPGLEGVKGYSNTENFRRFSVGGGFCDEEKISVDIQTIDVTNYSSKNGGVMEGSFNINVYHKPIDKCANYEKQTITGSYKLKRVNYE